MKEMLISLQLKNIPTQKEVLQNFGYLLSLGTTFESLAMWLETQLGADVKDMDDEPLLTDISFHSGREDDWPMTIVISSPILDSYELVEHLQSIIKAQMQDYLLSSPLPLELTFDVIDD